MDLVISRPPVYEEGDGDEERTRDHSRQAILGLLDSVLGRKVLQDAIRSGAQKEQSYKRANADAQV